ncbi:SapC family protein [Luteibacter sp.]|uniref:SapC family protein n=1 Tax=Luteibacter sp. TaxID=1886636 RepID=UPI003F7EDFD9
MKQLLIYDRPRQLNRAAHRGLRLVTAGTSHAFARGVNSVPVVAAEFARAGLEYPIVFAGQPGQEQPAVLLGLHGADNLFVDDAGQWAQDAYVPAFIRRYPFVLAEGDNGEDFTVCVDEGYAGFARDQGEPLFNDDGSDTELLAHALRFLSDFQAGLGETRAFTARLRALGLLETRTLHVQPAQGAPSTLDGFQVVSAERLAALKGKPLATLHASGDLGLVHAHLHSLHNVQRLSARLDRRRAAVAVN